MDREEMHNYWRAEYGTASYPCYEELDGTLQRLSDEEILGKNVLDLGSGRYSPSNLLSYFKHQVVQLDLGHPNKPHTIEAILRLPYDIEQLDLAQDNVREAIRKVLKFLHIEEPCREPPFDALVFQNVLNYVSSGKILDHYLQFLKPGGLCIVGNSPSFGHVRLFSEERFRSNEQLQIYLRDAGHDLVEEQWLDYGIISPFLLSVTRKAKN